MEPARRRDHGGGVRPASWYPPARQRRDAQAGILEYGKPPTDAFLDTQLALGATLRAGGLSGLYLHAAINPVSLASAHRAAREVLSDALAALVDERYPAVVMLRHALFQEGALGVAGMSKAG